MSFAFLKRLPWYGWVGIAVVLVVVAPIAVLMTVRTGAMDKLSLNSTSMGYATGGAGIAVAPSVAADYDTGNDGMAYGKSEEMAQRYMPTPERAPSAGESAAEVDQKIIKTANLTLQVEDVPTAAQRVVSLATERGGFVQHSSVSEGRDGSKYGSVIVRVPAARFDDALSAFRGLALVVSNESVSGQDVTERYTDLAARLRNAKAQEQVYLGVLAKATKVEEILQVQSYLGSIRETVERYEGQLKYMENQTSLSTINVSLSEEPSVPVPGKEFRPGTAVKEAWRTLVALGQASVIFAIWFGIIGGAILVPLALVIWLIVWLVRRKRTNTIK